MPGFSRKGIRFFILICLFFLVIPAKGLRAMETGDCLAVIATQLSRSLDVTLDQVAQSIKALARACVSTYEATSPMDAGETDHWMKQALENGKTLSFQPVPMGSREPPFQAPVPAYLFYNGRRITPDVTRELKTFVTLAPLFKAAYETFRYSWVYMTTVNEAFLIYPYLPLNEAVNNLPPTEKDFYKAADFDGRTFGWERPYLDLAGAGMMVTVSYPVYNQGKLLGVISRDITLTQLSNDLLKPVTGRSQNMICLIMDREGLAIAASTPEAAGEIDRINSGAGKAVLYYRTAETLNSLSNPDKASSCNALLTAAGEAATACGKKYPSRGAWPLNVKTDQGTYRAAAAKIPATGWLILVIDRPS